mmetsp:Transcript_7451/g.23038  ORF Transcript_7451/g.23038 Transcript_7451/m.23038 type:complete len:207 (-) Transcript_7451:1289-1909(-)
MRTAGNAPSAQRNHTSRVAHGAGKGTASTAGSALMPAVWAARSAARLTSVPLSTNMTSELRAVRIGVRKAPHVTIANDARAKSAHFAPRKSRPPWRPSQTRALRRRRRRRQRWSTNRHHPRLRPSSMRSGIAMRNATQTYCKATAMASSRSANGRRSRATGRKPELARVVSLAVTPTRCVATSCATPISSRATAATSLSAARGRRS